MRDKNECYSKRTLKTQKSIKFFVLCPFIIIAIIWTFRGYHWKNEKYFIKLLCSERYISRSKWTLILTGRYVCNTNVLNRGTFKDVYCSYDIFFIIFFFVYFEFQNNNKYKYIWISIFSEFILILFVPVTYQFFNSA